MMDLEIIKKNEDNNDGFQVHLYYHPLSAMWLAFGRSAYLLRIYVKAHNYDNLRAFSKDLNLPCVAVTYEIVRLIRRELTILDENKEAYLQLVSLSKINLQEYFRWEHDLKEKFIKKEPLVIRTRVSDLVPKDCFIPDKMSDVSRNSKRIIDCFVALISMIVFSPLFLFCYILVKKEDGGPAIFKQERLGRFGRPFHIYKFRSMRLDAEKFGPQLSHSGGEDDPRLTPIGRFLRSHHLDELPQLWNVFCGDMAFIGPRPERKFYIDQILEYDKRYVYLYQIRPGVTSYATLYNGYTDTMEKMLQRLEYDLYYLEHRSLWFDAKILIKTFCNIVFGNKF